MQTKQLGKLAYDIGRLQSIRDFLEGNWPDDWSRSAAANIVAQVIDNLKPLLEGESDEE